MMFKYRGLAKQENTADIKQGLISFYEGQLRLFAHRGIGGRTTFGVKITEKLIQCTANRLDQIKIGKKTDSNTCYIERMMKILGRPMGHPYSGGKPQLINSNRSFISGVTSKFHTLDLGKNNRLSVPDQRDPVIDHTHYIDKVSTAYNSEIMQAVLSHDN